MIDPSQDFLESLILIHNNFYRQMHMPVPINQMGVLCALRSDPNLTISEISRWLNISKQQMTILIDKLVQNGLIEKNIDVSDRRRHLLILTAAGEKLLDEQDEVVKQKFSQQSQKLNDSELALLVKVIGQYRHLLEKMFID